MVHCISHHHACECREEKFRRTEEENERLKREMQAAQKEIRWLTRLTEILRDHGDLRYNGNKGILAFSDLKDLAREELGAG